MAGNQDFGVEFDGVAQLTAAILDAPVALISIAIDGIGHLGTFGASSDDLPPVPQSLCWGVFATNGPLIGDDLRDSHGDHVAVVEYGTVAYAGLPVRGIDGQAVGAADGCPRQWTDSQKAALGVLAAMVSASWQARELARTQTLLLDELALTVRPPSPDVDGWQVAVRCEQADGQFGGDWYDVTACDDGNLQVTLGDVVGKGVRAVRHAVALRHLALTSAVAGHMPDETIVRLGRYATTNGHDAAGSAVCVRLGRDRGEVTWAVAGHCPPMLRDPGGTVRTLDGSRTGTLGWSADARPNRLSLDAEPGSVLVVYSDGVVERPGEDLGVGLNRLRETISGCSDDPELIADAVMGAGSRSGDDRAVVAVQL